MTTKISYTREVKIVTEGTSPTRAVEAAEIEQIDKFGSFEIAWISLFRSDVSGLWQCSMYCTRKEEV